MGEKEKRNDHVDTHLVENRVESLNVEFLIRPTSEGTFQLDTFEKPVMSGTVKEAFSNKGNYYSFNESVIRFETCFNCC